MIKLWGVLRKRQRIAKQETVTAPSGDARDVHDAVDELCRAFDIARPVWLDKHENEMEKFGRTIFLADDFMESVAFDRFEVEILKEEKTRNRDPRNDFS